MSFREIVRCELERRQAANRRYSLRSFARALGIDHSALSQILRGRRRLTARTIERVGARLRMPAGEIAELCAQEDEAAILAAVDRRAFRPDSRWLAAVTGIPVDRVNATLQRLLRKRLLIMATAREWRRTEVSHG